jgi:peptidase S41-like protein
MSTEKKIVSSLSLCAFVLESCLRSAFPTATSPRHDVYLPAELGGGSPYCFNPESSFLRASLTRQWSRGDQLDTGGLIEDVAFLHTLLEKQYAGYPELLQLRDFDVERFFVTWADRVRRASPLISAENGVYNPNVELRVALTDNHFGLQPWLRELANDPRLAFYEYQAPIDAEFRVDDCAVAGSGTTARSTLARKQEIGIDRTTLLLTASARGFGETLTIRCGGQDRLLHRRPVHPRPPGGVLPPYEWRSVGDTAVIRIREFKGPPKAIANLKEIARDYPNHRKHRRIVFDLRGNGGGDDSYLYDWIDVAKKGVWLDVPELHVEGLLWPCFRWNMLIARQIVDGRIGSEDARVEREALRSSWPDRPLSPHLRLDPSLMEGHAAEPYEGRIVVLIDRNTVSSGEGAATALRRALGARVLGERSGGFTQYTNAPTFVLPRTGIPWVIPTKRNFHEGQVEGVGLPVDSYLANIEEPVEALIPCLSAGSCP